MKILEEDFGSVEFDAREVAERELKPLLKVAFDKANEIGVNIIIAVELRNGIDVNGDMSSDISISQRIDKKTVGMRMMGMVALANSKDPVDFIVDGFIPAMKDIKMQNEMRALRGDREQCDCLKCALSRHFDSFRHQKIDEADEIQDMIESIKQGATIQ